MADHRPEAELTVLLARLGAQLHAANRMGVELEDTIGEMVHHAAGQGRTQRAALQRLDMLVQSLENLAIYVEALSREVPRGIPIDAAAAAAQVKLRALFDALTTAPPSNGPRGESEGMELF